MHRVLVATGIYLLTVGWALAQPVAIPGPGITVKVVQGDHVVLQDYETQVTYTVQVGELVKGWTVVEITATLVTLEYLVGEVPTRVRLPVLSEALTPTDQ